MDSESLRAACAGVAGADGLIDSDELARALKIADPLLAKRIFAEFDEDGSGHSEIEEFLDAVDKLACGAPEAH